MNYLADTHILIWALLDSPKLSEKARTILLDRDNNIYYIDTLFNQRGSRKKAALNLLMPTTLRQVPCNIHTCSL